MNQAYAFLDALPAIKHIKEEGQRGRFGIVWQVPDFYQKHIANIRFCSRVHQILQEKVTDFMSSNPLNLERIIISLNEKGPFIEVEPGENGCYIHPHMNGLGDHNIDTWEQALALQQIFIMFLECTYLAMYAWEDNPELNIDHTIPQPVRLEFRADFTRRPVEVYPLINTSGGQAGFVLARSAHEARQLAEKSNQGFTITHRYNVKPQIIFNNHP